MLLLLPGALAAQQPVAVSIPTADGEALDVRRAFGSPAAAGDTFALHRASGADPEDLPQRLGSLGDILPRELCRDLLELRARVQRYRTVLFGDRGILRWGRLGENDRQGRIRLNLQADPHPGLRVTLITR